jgi:L-threonylcarbamoyladenylate synthase
LRRRRTERLFAGSGRGSGSDDAGDRAIGRAAEVLRAGGLVAFPTETVYGLGARADQEPAVRAIFEAKGRPSHNPLIVHVADIDSARPLAGGWSADADALARAFWPGPLTLIVARPAAPGQPPIEGAPRGGVAESVTAGGSTLGLRVPAHPVARALLRAVSLPVAAPSANRSSRISPTTADHVMKMLDGRIDACLDGGAAGYGIESTIVDVTSSPAILLRAGAIAAERIAEHVRLVDRSGAVIAPGDRPRAPSGFARHYAPEARVVIVPSAEVEREALARGARGERVGALVRGARPAWAGILVEALADDPAGYAAQLYAALHRLEDARCDVIVVGSVPDDSSWAAVRDRIGRASVEAAAGGAGLPAEPGARR